MANVLLHLALGMILMAVAAVFLRRYPCSHLRVSYSRIARLLSRVLRQHARPSFRLMAAHRAGSRRAATYRKRAHSWPSRTGRSLRRGRHTCTYIVGVDPHPSRPECAHRESRLTSAFDESGRRRSRFALRSRLRANQHRPHHPFELLHGFRNLRRVPQGHLPTVEEFHAPHGLVQQSVLSEVHRVHAGA
jgi:hypothetical protein